MKHRNFLCKLLGLLAVAGLLWYYQNAAGARAAALAENAAAIAEIEAYNRAVERENAAALDEATEEAEPDRGPYRDGVYEGEGAGYGGPIRVSVAIAGGYIERIDVLEHSGEDPAYYMLAESLLEAMIAAQTGAVDAATGATFSSAGLIQAVSSALEQAVM